MFSKRSSFLFYRFFNFRITYQCNSVSTEDIEKIKKFKENQLKEQNDTSKSFLSYDAVKKEFSKLKQKGQDVSTKKIPKFSDIVIIGGGIVGSSIAYSLKQRAPDSFKVTVIERDSKYTHSSSTLSVGGIRQQFSLPENIQLSMYSAEFLRNIKQHLSVLDDDPPDICFQPHGYLFLASEAGAQQMMENHKVQRELGAKVELMGPKELKQKFPWLNTDGIELGSYGIENEGWFDPWALLSAFKKKSISLGADYVDGEVIGFEFKSVSPFVNDENPQLAVNYVYLKDEQGEVHCVEFTWLIVAGGPYSGEIGKMLHMGLGPGLLQLPIPVEPRKRYVYVTCCENGPGIDMPLIVDPSGTYIRREGLGGKYICGRSPSPAEEPDVSNLEVDYNFFENSVWPIIAKRIPTFECLKVSSAWAGYYDYNTFDQNALIGYHPYFPNVVFATGFSGHGIQMAPGIGRAIMELILDGDYYSIDLSRFALKRLYLDTPLLEKNIV